jgi:DNA-binding response OmpR family regulator
MKWNIVYFDDDAFNIDAYKLMLQEKFNIIGFQDGNQHPKVMEEVFPHAFLIDVHMPLIDGFSLYKKIIAHPRYNGCPIFFISGDQSDLNKIRSYEQGGIDFFPRTISEEEMVLRLNNKIQLFLRMGSIIELGNLKIDSQTFKVFINNQLIDLTLIEMRILSLLLRTFPEAASKKHILKQIWGDDGVKQGTMSTHLTNLRSKVGDWTHTIKLKEDFISIQKEDEKN